MQHKEEETKQYDLWEEEEQGNNSRKMWMKTEGDQSFTNPNMPFGILMFLSYLFFRKKDSRKIFDLSTNCWKEFS